MIIKYLEFYHKYIIEDNDNYISDLGIKGCSECEEPHLDGLYIGQFSDSFVIWLAFNGKFYNSGFERSLDDLDNILMLSKALHELVRANRIEKSDNLI